MFGGGKRETTMRTLGLAIAMALCLGTTAAHAVCTTGVECIRERFGVDQTVRNNRIIDQTDTLGDRGRPLNPYVARQNVANQARRAGRFDATGDRRTSRFDAEPRLEAGTRPDVRFTPDASGALSAPVTLVPGAPPQARDPAELTVAPVQPATGAARDRATGFRAAGTRAAAPTPRDQNQPVGAANRRFTGPQTSGAYR
jgi:hypothetical protein